MSYNLKYYECSICGKGVVRHFCARHAKKHHKGKKVAWKEVEAPKKQSRIPVKLTGKTIIPCLLVCDLGKGTCELEVLSK